MNRKIFSVIFLLSYALPLFSFGMTKGSIANGSLSSDGRMSLIWINTHRFTFPPTPVEFGWRFWWDNSFLDQENRSLRDPKFSGPVKILREVKFLRFVFDLKDRFLGYFSAKAEDSRSRWVFPFLGSGFGDRGEGNSFSDARGENFSMKKVDGQERGKGSFGFLRWMIPFFRRKSYEHGGGSSLSDVRGNTFSFNQETKEGPEKDSWKYYLGYRLQALDDDSSGDWYFGFGFKRSQQGERGFHNPDPNDFNRKEKILTVKKEFSGPILGVQGRF